MASSFGRRLALGTAPACVALLAAAVGFFLRYQDPMVLIFGFQVALLLAGAAVVWWVVRGLRGRASEG